MGNNYPTLKHTEKNPKTKKAKQTKKTKEKKKKKKDSTFQTNFQELLLKTNVKHFSTLIIFKTFNESSLLNK